MIYFTPSAEQVADYFKKLKEKLPDVPDELITEMVIAIWKRPEEAQTYPVPVPQPYPVPWTPRPWWQEPVITCDGTSDTWVPQ